MKKLSESLSIIFYCMISFTEIVACQGTVVYEGIKGRTNFFTSGKLEVLIAYDGMILLRVNHFEYPVNGQQTIIFDKSDPQFALVIYLRRYPEDQWIVKMNENTDAVYSCLDEKAYMKDKNGKTTQASKVTFAYQGQKKKEPVAQKDMGVKEEKQEKNLLIEASKGINKGLKYSGQVLSKGFESFGGFIAKKVEKQEEKEVSKDTKENLEKVKDTTKNVLEFASAGVGKLIQLGKKAANNVGQKFESSQKGKELQEDPRYETVKKGAKTGVGMFANIYEGVVDAVYSAGSGISKGAGKVIGAKYGEEAGEAADEAMEGAGNVLKIVRVPEDQLAKNFKG